MTSYNDKRSIHREDIIILNVYEANRTTKQMKQKLTEMKRETDKPIIIAGDFNTSLSVIDRTSRQKDQQQYRRNEQPTASDIYRAIHPPETKYTLFQVPMEHSPR